MPILQAQQQCPVCQSPQLFAKPGVNNLIHGLVTVFTCGLWLIVWIIVAMVNSLVPYRCQKCGTPARLGGGAGSVVLGVVGGIVFFFLAMAALVHFGSSHEPPPSAVPSRPANPPATNRRVDPAPDKVEASDIPFSGTPRQDPPVAPPDNEVTRAAEWAQIATEEKKKAADKVTFKFHSEKAQEGSVSSMYRLGQLYLAGQGCQADTNQAKVWFQKAASLGNEDAATALNKLTP